jgi:hypothetical protein
MLSTEDNTQAHWTLLACIAPGNQAMHDIMLAALLVLEYTTSSSMQL